MTSATVNPRRAPDAPAFLASSILALVIAGCGSLVGGQPTASTPVAPGPPTGAPLTTGQPGRLHMIARPGYAASRVELAYMVGGSRVEGESIDQDVEIIVNRDFPPGELRVEKNGLLCDGAVEIVSNVETDVLLRFGSQPERCELFTTETHPPGSIDHPELPLTAAVGAYLPFGLSSVFVVRSLDDPEAPPVAEVTVDDPPYEAAQIVVQPGRYQVSVVVDGAVLAEDTVELERGENRIMLLRVLPPDVPRDCGNTPAATCERVIQAGYAWGLFPGGREYVTAVRVRPSEVSSCMHPIEGPLFDVTVELANPKGDSAATVGRLPNGRYDACSY